LVYGSIAPFVPLFAISTAKPLHVDSVGFAAAAILDIDATSLLFSLWTKLTSIWLLVPFLILLLTHRLAGGELLPLFDTTDYVSHYPDVR